jgi:DNA mismatch endonuclease (patch repair protein)
LTLTRSEQMARIGPADTAPEVMLRRALKATGIRCRSNVKTQAVRADLVVGAKPLRVAVFIDGCFWHGCPEHYVPPRSRIEFWAGKLDWARDEVVRSLGPRRLRRVPDWRVQRIEWLDEERVHERRWMVELREALSQRFVERARRTRKARAPASTGPHRVR